MSDYLKNRLTSDDIVNRAANGRWPHAEPLCAHLLLESERYPQSLMAKRKVEPFYLVTPEPKTKFDDRQPHESIGQYARRMTSQFEEDLVTKQKNDLSTSRRHLLSGGVAIFCFAAILAWLVWGTRP